MESVLVLRNVDLDITHLPVRDTAKDTGSGEPLRLSRLDGRSKSRWSDAVFVNLDALDHCTS